MRKTRFELVGIKGSFEGFTTGDLWNGWACPYFTRMEGQRVVLVWNSQLEGQNERGQASFNGTDNCFEFLLSGEVDRFGAEVIDGVDLYPIGTFGWCWMECEDDLKPGDLVTYADPQDKTERAFIGTVLEHFPDADPPRTTVRWDNSGLKLAPICREAPNAWVRMDKKDSGAKNN